MLAGSTLYSGLSGSVGGKSVLKEVEASGVAQSPASDPNIVLDRGEALSFLSVSDTHVCTSPLSK